MIVPSSRLVRNASPKDHLDALAEVFGKSTKISIAVAFLKSKGLKKVDSLLQAQLKAGAKMEIFVGSDFCLTQPVALDDLLKLSKRYPSLKVFVAKAEARSTFHPKLYLGIGDKEARILIGSANLTGGALGASSSSPPSRPATSSSWTIWAATKARRSAIRAAGAKLFFLPPYSPDLNPIEQVFAKLKRLLRKAAERSVDATWKRIGSLLDAFPPHECANYLRNAGYASI